MKTKVSILGETPKENKESKIVFEGCLRADMNFEYHLSQIEQPAGWDEIILLARNYGDKKDLMLAKDVCGTTGLYIGYFNDGVV